MAASGWTPEEAALARGETRPPKNEEREPVEDRRARQPAPEDDPAGDEPDAGDLAPGGEPEAEEDPDSPEVLKKRLASTAQARDRERNKRKETERAAREAERRLEMLNERLNTMSMVMQQQQRPQQPQMPQQPQKPPPTIEDDPAGFLRAVAQNQGVLAENQRRIYAEQQEARRQAAVAQQVAQQQQQIDSHFAQDLNRVAEEVPDVRDGIAYLYNQRLRELAIQGYTEPQARAIIDRTYYQSVAEWAQQGYSPAEAFYAIAQERGYRPRAAGNGQANGQQQEYERRDAAQRAAQSLGSMGGSAPRAGAKFTAKTIGDMPQKDFEAWMEKVGPDGFRDMMTRPRG